MTTKYTVTCYSPPSSLHIKSGDTAEVEGYRRKNNIRADSIVNITKNGSKCLCEHPKALAALLGENVTVKGKVSNVQQSSDFVQFDLETEQ